jgi:protein-S-isoprenylcysteine O-methyltransferase Ste14
VLFCLIAVQESRSSELHRADFKTRDLYRIVHHPVYLGLVIAFWSAQVMTVEHLLFSVATTGYTLMAIFFEERELIAACGQAYRDYRARVPMMIPLLKMRGHTQSNDERPKVPGTAA